MADDMRTLWQSSILFTGRELIWKQIFIFKMLHIYASFYYIIRLFYLSLFVFLLFKLQR